MSENVEPAGGDKAEDESVLSLQNLEGADEEAEIEAHASRLSVAICGVVSE
ncbi:hypothetical protein ABZ464_46540 [Streptomyces sp. NPDC005820]|uniref:hypothetical protein n=1 Tax=Streptomyces sp. NPDC005820 TaxID=3157069 RepID=UPI0034032B49